MRKLAVFFLLIVAASSLFAQDEGWRDRGSRRDRGDRYRYFADDTFELTPFGGYTWGGKIYSGQTTLLGRNAEVESSGNFGIVAGIPLQPNGMKLELMADRQNTNFTTGSDSLFGPSHRLGQFDITYLHAGVLVPIGPPRGAVPFFVVSAGVANLDPRSSGTSSSTRFSASAGMGVKIPIQSHAGFRGEIRGFYTSLPNDVTCNLCNYVYNRDLFQGQANFGLYFKF